ncbi:MAG: hypothetical protein O3A93_09160 [Chloroflexi bacterium]|nr:hypothetical protein [Chloroflexota bacterium]MDA1271415.1 hypothetical protein [Chloroflexota bacterium]
MPSDVPEVLMEQILKNYTSLCNEWDQMYPNNPILGHHDDEER